MKRRLEKGRAAIISTARRRTLISFRAVGFFCIFPSHIDVVLAGSLYRVWVRIIRLDDLKINSLLQDIRIIGLAAKNAGVVFKSHIWIDVHDAIGLPKDLAQDQGDITVVFLDAISSEEYENAFLYTGEAIEHHRGHLFSGIDCVRRRDIKIISFYENNIDAGTATVKVTGIGNFSDIARP